MFQIVTAYVHDVSGYDNHQRGVSATSYIFQIMTKVQIKIIIPDITYQFQVCIWLNIDIDNVT